MIRRKLPLFRSPGSIREDADGMTIVEFGLIAPVFFLLLFGLFDAGQLLYAKTLLQGSVEIAARASSLETGDTSAADAEIEEAIKQIAPSATLTSSRVSYFDFADIGRPEQWNDENGNGICDDDENYTDENGNGTWDPDIGVSGNGGANDVVMYNVEVSYERLFKVPLLPGSKVQTITASAVKKNQPFADQSAYGSTAGTCS